MDDLSPICDDECDQNVDLKINSRSVLVRERRTAFTCGMDDRERVSLWVGCAIWAQAVLLVYLEAIEWVDMFPWNDVRSGNGQEGFDIALGILIALAIVTTARRSRRAIWLWSAVYAVWLGLQVQTFGWSYVFGASEEWKRVWARWFGQTRQLFPVVGDHLPPDACHFVIHLVLLAALGACAGAAYSLRIHSPAPPER